MIVRSHLSQRIIQANEQANSIVAAAAPDRATPSNNSETKERRLRYLLLAAPTVAVPTGTAPTGGRLRRGTGAIPLIGLNYDFSRSLKRWQLFVHAAECGDALRHRSHGWYQARCRTALNEDFRLGANHCAACSPTFKVSAQLRSCGGKLRQQRIGRYA